MSASRFGFELANQRFQRGARARSSTKSRKVEKLTVVMEDPDNVCEDHDDDDTSSCSDNPFDDVLPESLEADEEIRLHIMGLSSYFTSIVETNWASKIQQLPTRYLPPGSIKLLFWQFKVTGHECSYLHFWRVFREVWHNVLRFQAPSSHGQCDECASYKESFGRSGDPGDDQHRYEVARAFKDHITAVRRDRELETFLQAQRPLERHGCLAIHWDPWDLLGCCGFWIANFLGSASILPLPEGFRMIKLNFCLRAIPGWDGPEQVADPSLLQAAPTQKHFYVAETTTEGPRMLGSRCSPRSLGYLLALNSLQFIS